MKNFLSQLDTTRIEQAITDAERATSGEIRVVFHPGDVDDVNALARTTFADLGMAATRERNAVLILVAPDERQFAIYGDSGVHAKCGPEFWREVAAAMESHFRAARPTEAIIEGVTRAGVVLGREFPHRADDRNELPNTVVIDPPSSSPRVI